VDSCVPPVQIAPSLFKNFLFSEPAPRCAALW